MLDNTLNRRKFLGITGVAAFSVTRRSWAQNPAQLKIVRARRPQAPFRVWFQPRLFDRDMDLYANMTVDASGWLDPRLAELTGKTTLVWAYGLNYPYEDGANYWREVATEKARSRSSADSQFIAAGIAVDEWVPPARPDNEQHLAAGLRAAKRADPNLFIAVWLTDATPALYELARDGTVDLLIIEGYTHSVEPELSTNWDTALRRCAEAKAAGVMDKTIFCFGHITDRLNVRGEHITAASIRQRAQQLKALYPQMPGIAFFQSTDPETPELRELVRACDRISAEMWPNIAQA